VCMYVCVCICVYMSVYVYVRVFTCVYMYVYVCMYMCVYIYVCVYVCACVSPKVIGNFKCLYQNCTGLQHSLEDRQYIPMQIKLNLSNPVAEICGEVPITL